MRGTCAPVQRTHNPKTTERDYCFVGDFDHSHSLTQRTVERLRRRSGEETEEVAIQKSAFCRSCARIGEDDADDNKIVVIWRIRTHAFDTLHANSRTLLFLRSFASFISLFRKFVNWLITYAGQGQADRRQTVQTVLTVVQLIRSNVPSRPFHRLRCGRSWNAITGFGHRNHIRFRGHLPMNW